MKKILFLMDVYSLTGTFFARGIRGVGDLSYLPCAISSSMASSTLALKESSLASSSNSWAGDSSSNMPVILLAKA